MAFQCTIVTPEQQALDESVTEAILPAHDGQMGILTGRAPLLVKLGVGPLRIDLAGGQRRTFLVDGGVAEMKGDRLTILATLATPAAEIDAERARAEYAAAEASHPTDDAGRAERQRTMDRARAAQAIAGQK